MTDSFYLHSISEALRELMLMEFLEKGLRSLIRMSIDHVGIPYPILYHS